MYDFEGDPDQHLSERRIKRCPLRDVASMLTSFGYAAQSITYQLTSGERDQEAMREEFRPFMRFWYSHVSAAFLRGYWRTAKGALYMPPAVAQQQVLVETYLLERALLDVRSDIEDRPELAGMPFRLILYLLGVEAEAEQPAPSNE